MQSTINCRRLSSPSNSSDTRGFNNFNSNRSLSFLMNFDRVSFSMMHFNKKCFVSSGSLKQRGHLEVVFCPLNLARSAWSVYVPQTILYGIARNCCFNLPVMLFGDLIYHLIAMLASDLTFYSSQMCSMGFKFCDSTDKGMTFVLLLSNTIDTRTCVHVHCLVKR